MRQAATITAVHHPLAKDMVEPIVNALRSEGLTVHEHFGRVADIAQSGEWAETDVLLATATACTASDLAKASRLHSIISPILGIEGIDVEAASAQGVLVANGQVSENFESVAEATFLLMLASLYDLHGAEARLRRNDPRLPTAQIRARMLAGKQVGIVGNGNVARGILRRLSSWDASAIVYARTPRELPGFARHGSLEEVLSTSDVVILAVSLNAETRKMLDATRLGLIKRGAILINTSRGGLIDEAALIEAARNGQFNKIALDVFEEEPLSPDSPLRELADTILTPHAIAQTQESAAAMPRLAVESVLRVLAGNAPDIVQNPDVLPRWRTRFSIS